MWEWYSLVFSGVSLIQNYIQFFELVLKHVYVIGSGSCSLMLHLTLLGVGFASSKLRLLTATSALSTESPLTFTGFLTKFCYPKVHILYCL
jgi:hypothetical protein